MNREIRELTNVMTQMDLADISRTLHSNIKAYVFFLATHRTHSKIKYIPGNKTNLNRKKEKNPTHLIGSP